MSWVHLFWLLQGRVMGLRQGGTLPAGGAHMYGGGDWLRPGPGAPLKFMQVCGVLLRSFSTILSCWLPISDLYRLFYGVLGRSSICRFLMQAQIRIAGGASLADLGVAKQARLRCADSVFTCAWRLCQSASLKRMPRTGGPAAAAGVCHPVPHHLRGPLAQLSA